MTAFNYQGIYAIINEIHQEYGYDRILNDIAKDSPIPIIQFRFKTLSIQNKIKIINTAVELKKVRDICLIINDDVDMIDSLNNLDGVHVGQNDCPLPLIKEKYPDLIVGVSTHNISEAKLAFGQGADYIGCGAVFETNSKVNTHALGVKGLSQIVKSVSIPQVAIGGINETNIQIVAESGCSLVAVMSGLVVNNKFRGGHLSECFDRYHAR